MLDSGERRSWRGVEESLLITEGFAGVPANEVPALPPAAVVAFIESIWRAGVVQRDLHPANLLADPLTHEIRLVDLHGIELRETPREADRDLMLAVASMDLDLPVSAAVRRSSLALRKAALRARSKRCLKINRDFSGNTLAFGIGSCGRKPSPGLGEGAAGSGRIPQLGPGLEPKGEVRPWPRAWAWC